MRVWYAAYRAGRADPGNSRTDRLVINNARAAARAGPKG